jgi:hypothetical protein
MNCNCGAQPGDTAADHEPNCLSLQGPSDDPSDHYGQ